MRSRGRLAKDVLPTLRALRIGVGLLSQCVTDASRQSLYHRSAETSSHKSHPVKEIRLAWTKPFPAHAASVDQTLLKLWHCPQHLSACFVH